jgi:peptidoglycan/xylan/chitin deacetylase (PgdA/CDA1 family)
MIAATRWRNSAKAGLLAAGWYDRRLSRGAFPGVLVLCYHGIRAQSWRTGETAYPGLHVDVRTFEDHCDVIGRACQPISLHDWRAALDGGRPLPPRPVLVTFDDGYRSVFEAARPVLKRKGLSAVVFVCTEPVRTQRLFWFDAAARGVPAAQPDIARDPLAPMTAEQVRIMSDEGFEIGAHTATHPVLSRETEDVQRTELTTCEQTLASWTGRRPRAIAYPFGKPATDYSPVTVRLAEERGFDMGFTTHGDWARAAEPPLERSRFLVLSDVSGSELAHRMAHSWPR